MSKDYGKLLKELEDLAKHFSYSRRLEEPEVGGPYTEECVELELAELEETIAAIRELETAHATLRKKLEALCESSESENAWWWRDKIEEMFDD